jgi:hypothetical protein
VKQDVTLDPFDVSLFGAEGMVLQANRITYLVEELSWLRGGFCLCRDLKITHGCAKDCCVQSYNRNEENVVTEIGRKSSA